MAGRSTSVTTRRLQLDIAAAVRETRLALGWSQAELGRRSHLAQTTISMVERADGQASLVLFVLATGAVEQRVAENAEAIKRVYRVRGSALQEWLDRPWEASWTGRGLALIDPRRRGRRWVWASAIDGARAAPPYADYAAAARASTHRPRSGPSQGGP